MRINPAARWRALVAALLMAMLAPAPQLVTAAAADNASCLNCHDAKARPIEATAADGAKRTLRAISPDTFGRGVHAGLQCVACHTGITESPPEGRGHEAASPGALKSEGCAECHEKLWDKAKADGSAAAKPRLGVVVDNVAAYRKSYHALPDREDKSRPKAACDNCHDTHGFSVPPKSAADRTQWRQGIPALCGEQCHSDALDEYKESVHGQAFLDKHDDKAAICTDCHTSHAIGTTSADPVKLAITATCGSCHDDQYKTYKATYHGQVTTLGYTATAKCYDCHGSHTIAPVKDDTSKMHVDNRLETCRNCHNGRKGVGEAPAGFVSFQPHARTDDFERYPQVWIAFQMMVGLLVGTFAFFWLHTALWFFREYKERKQGTLQPHVKVSALPAAEQGRHFKRFPAIWRVAHLLFALSLMVLTLTGMPLFYPDAAWAPWVMQALGGPQVAGVIHRVCAVVFAGVFFWHLFYMGLRIWRQRDTWRWFGPQSLVPNLQDMFDIVAMFKWFLGKGPRPVFERWTYWEKFDYWAPFWGVTIIGVSGLMMWLPGVTGSLLPGWVFNVAAIFHGEEAFLAVVFLFTVHFFNNHFRPDKFPLEVVMFTGTIPLEHYRREHALEYERLVADGTLQQHLVDAPAAPMTLGSKVLGFVLIACGLVLLAGVAVGFFGSL